MNSADFPNASIPGGMTASCVELSAPCITPLNTEEVPSVTISAGRLNREIKKPLTAPSSAPSPSAIRIGSQMPPL